MSRLNIHVCPLCESKHLKQTITCVDYYASGETFDLFRCEDCGFQFTQNFPAETEIGRYYETSDYISHSDTKKGLVNNLYHLVRKRMLIRKAKLISHLFGKSSGTLLDIGAGTGYFANVMQQKEWEVTAIEKNPQARAFAKEHFNLDVYEETVLEDFCDKSFDAITLWHVMEHLEHLNETWERLHHLLSDDGILVVAVPNCSSYDAGKYKQYWAAYDVPRHLWHFTPDTIQQFGAKHNFILTAQYPMPFDAFYISMLSEKYKKSFSPFIKGMMTGIIAWLHTLAKKEKSSSIIYVFRRK